MAGDRTDVAALREQLRAAGVDLADGDVAGYLRLDTKLNLNAAAIGLGLEHVAYDPERFPGLVYTGTDGPTTVVLFGDGTMVAVDGARPRTAEAALEATVDGLRTLGLLDAGVDRVGSEVPAESVPLAVDLGE